MLEYSVLKLQQNGREMPAREQDKHGSLSSLQSAQTDHHSTFKDRKLRSYLLRAALVPILLVTYPAMAFFGPFEGRTEFYPFFHWNLFFRSTEVTSDAVIVVTEIDGQTLPEPTLFFDLPNYFAAAKNQDIRLAKMLDNVVHAERSGNAEMTESLTEVIESRFMPEAAQVKYDVAIIRYKPVERYRTGEIIRTEIIRSGEKKR